MNNLYFKAHGFRLLLFAGLLSSFTANLFAQSNPSAHDLSGGSFTFTGFGAGTTTTYPTSMQGWIFSGEVVAATQGANGNQALSNSSAGATSGNIKNETSDGISLLSTGSVFLGAIVVALNTSDREDITLTWSVQDITSGSTRVNAMKLQYRIGTSGAFTDVASSTYTSNGTAVKAKETFSAIVLPANANDEAVVQVRWLYYFVSGSGSRDRLRLDDITISSSVLTPACTAPTTQASNLGSHSIANTTGTLTWTRGDGDNILVIAKSGSAVNDVPVDASSYTADAAFGNGQEIGTGNFVVYSGTGTSVDLTGLSQNTTYHFALYEFSATGVCYKAPALTGNFSTTCTTPDNISSLNPVVASGQVNLTWVNGSCFDEVLVVARDGSAVSSTPSGDGSSYTANAVFASGSDIGSLEYVVYKGTGTNVTVTSLTNGNTYHIKIFTRKGTSWSSGVTTTAIPSTSVTLWTEGFDNNSQYTVTAGGEGNDGTADYFFRTAGSPAINKNYSSVNGNFFAGQDIDDGGWSGSASPSTLTWSGIAITGLANLTFTGDFASAANNTIDDNDYLLVEYRIDGGSWTNLISFRNTGAAFNTYFLEDTDFNTVGDGSSLNSTFASFTKSISGTGNTLDLRFTASVNAGDEDFAIDDFIITGTFGGLVYQNATWTPNAPSASTGSTNALLIAGSPTLSSSSSLNNLVIHPNASLAIGNSQTLTLNGNISGPGTLTGSANSSLVINGSGAFGSLLMNQTTPGSSNRLLDFTANRTTSGTISLGNELQILGALTHTEGTITTNSNLKLVAAGATTYGQIAGTGNGTISGPVSMQMQMPGTESGWRNFTSPFDTVSFGQLASQTNIYLTPIAGPPVFEQNVFTWSEEDKIWNTVSANETLYGNAYNIFFFNPSSNTITLSGTYSKAAMNFGALTFTNTGTASNDGWHLIANPYPSGIDWNAITRPSELTNQYATWSAASGNYLSWNGATGDAGQYIPPMHAVWVKASSTLSGDLEINSTHRVTNMANHFAKRHDLKNHIKIRVNSPQNSFKDVAEIYAVELGNDPSNAPKLMGEAEAPKLWFLQDGLNYSLLATEEHHTNEAHALGFSCSISGNYTFTFEMFEMEAGKTALLEDKKTGTLHPIASGSYTFNYQAGEAESGRFYIRYQTPNGIADKISKEAGIKFYAYTQGDAMLLNLSENAHVQVMDMQGKIVYTSTLEQGDHRIPLSASGVYVVQVESKGIVQQIKVIK